MFVRRRRGWEIPERLATPESVYLNRREILGACGLSLVAGMAGSLSPASAQMRAMASLYPAPRNSRYTIGRRVTPESVNTAYNSFFEFGAHKDIAGRAEALVTRPWEIRVDGLVENGLTLDIDDLIRRIPLEERLYRHRGVEGWSMTVPWTGFPLAAFVDLARPLSSARYLRMEAFLAPAMASGQKNFYPWPYVEGITMEEARSELSFLVTGAYGKPVAKVMGAPLRLHLPWKYGFKSIKSIVRFSFVAQQPLNFWQQMQPEAHGFWANVNPAVAHPGWSQASERDLATQERIPTRIFNGYGEFVAGLYAGLGDEPLWR